MNHALYHVPSSENNSNTPTKNPKHPASHSTSATMDLRQLWSEMAQFLRATLTANSGLQSRRRTLPKQTPPQQTSLSSYRCQMNSKVVTIGSVIKAKRQIAPADATVACHSLSDQPTQEDPACYLLKSRKRTTNNNPYIALNKEECLLIFFGLLSIE
ncbi:unnamed protein product [Symbiodinium natans]|uniref:Uncharacterized protein n=1 Tax=Symbiodinium natans TaxID=878477 RepID=A0A812RJG8_9DINO|nr:unnamed protein product [Symbiodinium natans]